ncbi:MAG: peptidase S8 [Deltaproteobacteria bacterium]|nr:peptidase S8 [Deltaproteobacteria bacterium]
MENVDEKRGIIFHMKAFVAATLVLFGASSAFAQASFKYKALLNKKSYSTARGFVPGEVIVDLKNDVPETEVVAFAARFGVKLEPASPFALPERIYRVAGIADPAAFAAKFAADPAVESSEPNHYVFATMTPNDPLYKHQWNMQMVRMPEAWDVATGAGVVVAVIDTGVACRVSDLKGTKCVDGWNFVDKKKDATDDHGHGTHVAGTIAQTTNNAHGVAGIAPKVKIMPLKVLDRFGMGTSANVVAAIRYAADHGARVINMSLGSHFKSDQERRAIAYAYKKGVVVVAAAGNDGEEGANWPARHDHVIGVSALDSRGDLAFYSNFGEGIDIAAPGGDTRFDTNEDGMLDGILQNTIVRGNAAEDDFQVYMGTSMAAPHVAAAAALVVSQGVTDPDKVETILKGAAKPRGDKARFGAGQLDVYGAVKGAGFTLGLIKLGAGLVALLVLYFWLRRKQSAGFHLSAGAFGGAVVASSGLFFLPYVGVPPDFPLADFVMRGLPDWDMAFLGADGYGNALAHSPLAVVLFVGLLYSVPRARGLLVGLAVGVAANLAVTAASGTIDVLWIPGKILGIAWLVLGALISLVVAYFVWRKD